jgi:hypothetical protein
MGLDLGWSSCVVLAQSHSESYVLLKESITWVFQIFGLWFVDNRQICARQVYKQQAHKQQAHKQQVYSEQVNKIILAIKNKIRAKRAFKIK